MNIDVYGSYRQYQSARDAAWRALIDFQVCELPISLSKICNALNITILDNKHTHALLPNENGIAILQNEKWYIIFDETDIYGKQRFTVAHELGHILMGHTVKNGYYTRHENISKPADETKANIFASRLLAPACVLWGINARTAEQISEVCRISHAAAAIRAERMEVLRKRGKFLTSPLEQQVYKQFENYIRNNRL